MTLYIVGALIALVCVFGNINAYHQLGVEAGKKAAADVLSI